MGYTHSWEIRPEHPAWRPGFAQLQLDAKRIIEHCESYGIKVQRLDYRWKTGGILEGMSPSERHMLEEGEIYLNGWPESESCEDFVLRVDPLKQTSDWRRRDYAETGVVGDFCKTNRNPYDDVVCAILLRGLVLMPECFGVYSNGDWDGEWLAGADAPNLGPRVIYDYLFGDCPEESPLQGDDEE